MDKLNKIEPTMGITYTIETKSPFFAYIINKW